MTDIGGWWHLIREESAPSGGYSDTEPGALYIMLPFSEYTLGNLLGALKRVPNNGDWWYEVVSLAMVAMENLRIAELRSNFGDTFTPETLRDGSALTVPS